MKERLFQLRKSLGKTQDEFASAVGLSKNYVWQLEKGERTPSNRTISLICKTFHVSPKWLNTGEGEMFVEQDKHDRLSSWIAEISLEEDSDRRRIVEALTTLTEEQWSLLAEIAKKIAGEN